VISVLQAVISEMEMYCPDPVISWEGAEAVFIPPEAGDEDES
jgi:hypothetical protein